MSYKTMKRDRGKVYSRHYMKDTSLNRLKDILKEKAWWQIGESTYSESGLWSWHCGDHLEGGSEKLSDCPQFGS